jgi:hypothetical protein
MVFPDRFRAEGIVVGFAVPAIRQGRKMNLGHSLWSVMHNNNTLVPVQGRRVNV